MEPCPTCHLTLARPKSDTFAGQLFEDVLWEIDKTWDEEDLAKTQDMLWSCYKLLFTLWADWQNDFCSTDPEIDFQQIRRHSAIFNV